MELNRDGIQITIVEGGGAECFLRSHVVRKTTSLASRAARLAVCGGPRGENTHGFSLVWCSTGRKEGAW